MAWYDKYMTVYGKPFSEVQQSLVEETRNRLSAMQSNQPLASLVVIAFNEETHLMACLWALSEVECRYPVEIIGVDNDSQDRTAKIFEKVGIPYYTEYRHSCGYARQRGLQHSRGRFYFDVDSDTLYPPMYFQLMLEQLMKPGVSCVSASWSYYPDDKHSKLGLRLFELTRDLFLWIQHFKRPELSVRGLVFAYNADYGRKEPYRVDLIRGEDGSMAFNLKKYGRITFLWDRRARAITGYGTNDERTLWHTLWKGIRLQSRNLLRIFYQAEKYVDSEDNLIKEHK